jgi:hypothetical protein
MLPHLLDGSLTFLAGQSVGLRQIAAAVAEHLGFLFLRGHRMLGHYGDLLLAGLGNFLVGFV